MTEYHHGGLYYSLHLLFEERLGWELYRPIGYDWYEQGYWKIAEPYGNAQGTIDQYLAINDKGWIPYVNLNGNYKLDDNVYHVWDGENNFQHRAITFAQFKKMQFDFIMPTYPTHENWGELIQFQPRAKFLMQLGNEGQTTRARNVLSSVFAFQPNHVDQKVFYYHQETSKAFRYKEVAPSPQKITSFVIGLPERETFERFKNALPEYEFKAYGPGSLDGTLSTVEQMADEMRASTFGWHIKYADGYGHLLHQWYSIGRPVITRGSFYQGKTGGLLLTDGETCIDLDKHSFEESLELIRYWSQPDNYARMSQAVRKRFLEVVNPDEEANRLKEWLQNIV